MNALSTFKQRLESLSRSWKPGRVSGRPELDLYLGVERRTAVDRYDWDGMRRGGDAKRPTLLLQYTLDGEGAFEEHGQLHAVTPGQAFTAVIPSRHRYFLPATSSSWTFCFVIVHHPYVVERLNALHRSSGPLIDAKPGSELTTRLLDLFAMAKDGAEDRFTRERRLFDWMLSVERAAHEMRHAPDRRERLLAEVRQAADALTTQRLSVDALAAALGDGRSNFTHRFSATTGLTPAAYLRDLRLERVRDVLLQGDSPLKAVAQQTGFANANHLIKAFRRRFGYTPAAFRRQFRPHTAARAGEVGRTAVNS